MLFVGAVRAGKSFTNLSLAVKYGLEHKKSRILLVLPSADQRLTQWNDFLELYKNAPFIGRINATHYTISLANGSVIRFRLGSMPHAKSLKGNKFDFLIMDEASLMEPIVWEEYLSFTLATTPIDRLKVIFSTTPKGNDYVYQMYLKGLDPNETAWASVHAPTTSNPMVTLEYIETLKKSLSPAMFRQEVLAEFIASSGALFENISTSIIAFPKSTELYCGIDLGFQTDSSVVTIVDGNNNIVDWITFNQIEMSEGAKRIANFLKKYNYPAGFIEINTYQGMLEMLRELDVENLYAFTTTEKSKKEIIDDLIVRFQDGQICLPNDPLFMTEFFTFGYVYNPKTRRVSYKAIGDAHDDIVMATAMAFNAKKHLKGFTFDFC